MGEAQQRVLVKRGPKRSLWAEVGPNPRERRAIKRFHDSGPLGGALDHRRASRERRALARLAALGFRVPAVFGLTRAPDAVELSMEWIDGAVTLFDLVHGIATWPVAPERVARELGRVLARARAHGVTFADLHSKNVLIDAGGHAWLVDVAGVTVRGTPLARGARARDVVTILAELRERTSLAWRLRLIVAAERASGGRTSVLRRAVGARAARRWTRDSSVTAAISRGAEHGLRVRTIDEQAAWIALDSGAPSKIVADARSVDRAWNSTARFVEHALPCHAPLSRTRERAVFDDRGATLTLVEFEKRCASDARARRHAARSLGRLFGTLYDRGLTLASPLRESIAFDPTGEACLTPRAIPVASGAVDGATVLARALERSAGRRERALFVGAFLGAVETTAGARTRLRERLSRAAPPPREPWRRRVRGLLGGLAPLSAFTRFERTTRANLKLALGAERSDTELDRIARGVRRHAARQFAEWLRLANTKPEHGRWIEDLVEIDASVAILERELARRKGAIVVTAHIGNWELLAARLRRSGFAGAVVGYRRPRDRSARWFERIRERYGVVNIAQSSHPRVILRALDEGRVVGLLADLEVRRLDGEFLPFFGSDALTMTAPAALSRASRRPLIPARCVLDARRGRYVISFEEPLAFDPALDRRGRVLDLTRRLNGVFERWIRADPDQWAWHQPRWRTRRGDLEIVPLPGRAQANRRLEGPGKPISLQSVDLRLSSD